MSFHIHPLSIKGIELESQRCQASALSAVLLGHHKHLLTIILCSIGLVYIFLISLLEHILKQKKPRHIVFNWIYFKKKLELSFNFLILFDCHFKSHPLNEDWYVVGLLIIFPDEEIVACVLMKTMSPWLISTIIEWVELWSSPTVWLSERAPPFLSEFTISSVKMSPLKLL